MFYMTTVVPKRGNKKKKTALLGFSFMNIHLQVNPPINKREFEGDLERNQTKPTNPEVLSLYSHFSWCAEDAWDCGSSLLARYLFLTAHTINSMQWCLMSLVTVLWNIRCVYTQIYVYINIIFLYTHKSHHIEGR